MRTSEEIYHRVRWDARFDPACFVMGVAQRGTVPKRVPLPRFTPGGDIPWHRVLFFEADGEVVWDRSSGVDRIDATDAGRVRTPRRLPSPYFTSRTPHAYCVPEAAWTPVPEDAPAPARSASLALLTWNTLWDRYDSDRIDTARRRPLLLDALHAANADVIALQEAEPALLGLLLATPWVRESYTLWADPAGRDVADCGLLLLSRVPVREAGLHVLGPHKAVAAVVVETAEGPVTLAVTHLSSDHSANGATRRDAELADLAAGLAAIEGDVMLLGDFNDGGDTPQDRLGMADAWSRVRGAGDRTPTFDPSVNPLAAVSSLTGRASRLDRVLVRSERLRPVSAALLGDVPTPDGLYVSDHFGVRVELTGASEDGSETDAAEIVRRVSAALPDGRVHPVGSRRMGCALPGADVDLVAALPGDGDLPGTRERLTAALPEAVGLREVTGARVPGLRFCLDGLRVDLVTVATGDLSPDVAVARRSELGEVAATALSAVSDADAVLAAADPHRAAFTRLAREVKAWARARGLDSAPCGGLPGLAWSVLAARTAHEAGDLPPLPLLRHFFATWAVWDWNRPVGSGEAGELPLTVLTPTAPVRPCTSQVSPAGRDLIAEELFRAWEILESAAVCDPVPHALLCAPPPLHLRHAAWAIVSVRPGPDEGRFRGRLLALLAALAEAGSPDAHAWPRPFGADASHIQYAIGLGRTPPDEARLAEIGARLLRGIPEAGLRRAGRGAAPELR
ncbi:poly(A) polymerase [Streptomyces atratus]|uniref:Endonuclease/exonuclease/phosphatase n=1 Tax=Streptomyces atratus TaxID=1893 RepID=A0A2Z5JH63_STRAR|nr:poly(A) polymerase [Streptomyces atratus]AXE79583.1 endonuclease/exonuclease/phosphatase [Streptomyces atratus]